MGPLTFHEPRWLDFHDLSHIRLRRHHEFVVEYSFDRRRVVEQAGRGMNIHRLVRLQRPVRVAALL